MYDCSMMLADYQNDMRVISAIDFTSNHLFRGERVAGAKNWLHEHLHADSMA